MGDPRPPQRGKRPSPSGRRRRAGAQRHHRKLPGPSGRTAGGRSDLLVRNRHGSAVPPGGPRGGCRGAAGRGRPQGPAEGPRLLGHRGPQRAGTGPHRHRPQPVAPRGRRGRRRNAGGVGHSRAAGLHPGRGDRRGWPDGGRHRRRVPGVRRRVGDPGRCPAHPRGPDPGHGRKGRLQALHAEGDPRTAPRADRHDARPGLGGKRRNRLRRRGADRGRPGLGGTRAPGGVRDVAPRGPRREAPAVHAGGRAGGSAPGQRVRPGGGAAAPRRAVRFGQPVGRDAGYAEDPAGRSCRGRADPGDLQRRGVLAGPGCRPCRVHPRGSRNQRGVHQGVHHADRHAVPAGAGARPRPGGCCPPPTSRSTSATCSPCRA